MAAQGLQGRPRHYPVTITIDHDVACYAIDEWVKTQETNGLPTDGQEFFDFLEEVGDRFPDAIVDESDDEIPSHPADRDGPDPERPPEAAGAPHTSPSDAEEPSPLAAGPPEAFVARDDDDFLFFAFMAWCQATWGDIDATFLTRPTSNDGQ